MIPTPSLAGRPDPSEAAPYYFPYIDQVAGSNLVPFLESQLEDSVKLFTEISEEKSLYRYAPGKWSIREVLSHISDTERVFTVRALWFARGFDTPLPSFDQNIAVSGARADAVSWAAHIEDFRRMRLSTISFFANLPQDAWMKTGIASDNRFTVRALAYIIGGHAAHHARIVREQYL